jgi:DNA-binding protein H-NS
MKTIAELQADIAALQKQIDARKAAAKKGVIKEIKAKMAEYEITVDDLQGSALTNQPKALKAPSVIKYRKSESETWGGGKGPKPKWVKQILDAGGDIEQYRIRNTDSNPKEKAVKENPNKIPLFS